MTNLTEATLEACWVASDQAYVGGLSTNGALLPVTPTAGTLQATRWTASCVGWTVEKVYDDAGTGFHATVYRRSTSGGHFDRIVAFRGSRGSNPQDWRNNLSFGWPDWASATASKLMDDLKKAVATTDHIAFTGHSLGGALAQYAAYEYVDTREQSDVNYTGSNVGLVTFNAPGVESSMKQFYGKPATSPGARQVGTRPYYPARLNGVDTRYYYVDNDFVSTLGTCLNDAAGRNDYLLPGSQPNGAALNLAAAHSQAAIYTALSGGFGAGAIKQQKNDRLDLQATQAIASIVSSAIYNEDVSQLQSVGLAYSGLIIGLAQGDPVNSAALINAVLKSLSRSYPQQRAVISLMQQTLGSQTLCVRNAARSIPSQVLAREALT